MYYVGMNEVPQRSVVNLLEESIQFWNYSTLMNCTFSLYHRKDFWRRKNHNLPEVRLDSFCTTLPCLLSILILSTGSLSKPWVFLLETTLYLALWYQIPNSPQQNFWHLQSLLPASFYVDSTERNWISRNHVLTVFIPVHWFFLFISFVGSTSRPWSPNVLPSSVLGLLLLSLFSSK